MGRISEFGTVDGAYAEKYRALVIENVPTPDELRFIRESYEERGEMTQHQAQRVEILENALTRAVHLKADRDRLRKKDDA